MKKRENGYYSKDGKGGKRLYVLSGVLMFFVLLIYVFGISGNEPRMIRDVSAEQEVQIFEILGLLDAGELSSVKRAEDLDETNNPGEKAFFVSAENGSDVILFVNEDGSVHSLRWEHKVLYKDGSVVNKITDVVPTTHEKSEFQLRAEKAVKSILLSPDSAKFPSYYDYVFDKTADRILVQGYVDASNSFGAMLRSDFEIAFDRDGDILSFIFDDEPVV